MPEILSNIVVQDINTVITADSTSLNVTPEAINLNIFTVGSPAAGLSNDGQLLYNNLTLIDGVPNTAVANGNLTFTNLSNLKIDGGNNGYFLQTDGTGNLSWVAGGGSGNGVVAGSNGQVQFNDGGSFGGSAEFVFNKSSNNLTVGNTIISNIANIANTVINSNGITTPGTYGFISNANVIQTIDLEVSDQVISSVATGTPPFVVVSTTKVANLFVETANGVAGATQSNITSVGTLTSVTSTGNITTNEMFGLTTGAGGTITQTGARTSTVTLNKPTGQITLFSGSMVANTLQTFNLNNSYINAYDMVLIQHISGGTLGLYNVSAVASINGQASISIRSIFSTPNEAPVLKFMVIKSVIT